jgi:hypothetical protein
MSKDEAIDLTRRPTAQPAQDPRKERLPLPAGRLIRPKVLTAGERKMLEEAGWQEGESVPEDLASIVAKIHQEATDPEQMPPPVPLDTPPVGVNETEIEELNPQEQERVKLVMQSVLSQAREMETARSERAGLPGSVQEAVSAADQVVVEDDTQSSEYSAGAPKEFSPEEADEPASDEAERCPRCGWLQGVSDPITVTEEDKDAFLRAVLGLRQFSKWIELYGGRLKVQVRTLDTGELDQCWRQISHDWDAQQLKTPSDQNEMLIRYRAALQIIAIEGLEKPVVCPQSFTEWEKVVSPSDDNNEGSPTTTVKRVWDAFRKQVMASESLYRLLIGAVQDFNLMVNKLEISATNPDF